MANGLIGRRKWMIFIITGVANLVVAFSINSFSLSLPLLEKEFAVSQSIVSWISIAYSLIPCCTLLIMGRTGELYGFRRQYMAGFVFYGAVSLAAPLLSKTIGMLIFFRCLQGLGYSAIISITQAILGRSFPVSERGKVLGINSLFVSVGMAVGPTIGGFLLSSFSWRALFYFSVPFCLIGFLGSFFILPNDKPLRDSNSHMDLPGACFLSLSLGALVIGITFIHTWGVLSAPFLACVLIFIAGFTLFIYRERTAASPLMELRLFRNKVFSLANAACMLSYLVQQMTTYLMPFYLINHIMLPSNRAGLVLLASPLSMMIVAPFGGGIADRKGSRLPAGAGLFLLCLCCLLLSFQNDSAITAIIVILLAIMGCGNGLSVPTINSAIITASPVERIGVASGTQATMRNLGQAFGVVCGSLILTLRGQIYHDMTAQKAYLLAQRDAFYFGTAISLIALIFIIWLPAKNEAPPR